MTDLLALVVQQSVNGIYLGCLYVMVALGLTLIYGVLNQINFAHADIVTLGAFAAYGVTHLLSGNYLAGIAAALALGAALGWLVNASIFAPLRERGSELLPLIATIGVSIMLQNAMLALFGVERDDGLARFVQAIGLADVIGLSFRLLFRHAGLRQ